MLYVVFWYVVLEFLNQLTIATKSRDLGNKVIKILRSSIYLFISVFCP